MVILSFRIINVRVLLTHTRYGKLENEMIDQRQEKPSGWALPSLSFHNYNYACFISLFNMGLAPQAIRDLASVFTIHAMLTNNVDIHLISSVFANDVCNHLLDMHLRCNWPSRFESFPPYLPLMQTWQALSQMSWTWICVRLMGSRPQCPIQWQEESWILEEAWRSYPLCVPWHPQETSMKPSH